MPLQEWPETPEAQLATKKVPVKKAAAKKSAAAKKTSASPSGGLALEHVGSMAGEIPVRISYRIIELFSAGLYSSPNKALEELVTNSYDAWSDHVDLLLPANLRASDATIWVVDNGESMDLAGLIDLWQIAKSTKRTRSLRAGRKPVGKFGIGKLATYVLASKLTYVCRRDGQVLAVTMDFGQVDQSADQDDTIVTLAVRSLDDDELHDVLLPMRQLPGGAEVADRIEAGEWETWTAAALSSLKPTAHELVAGMVRWILSTALPMSPAFSLTMNGKDVKSSVEKAKILKRWDVGKEKKDLPSGVDATKDDAGRVCVEIEGLGSIYGKVEIYKDLLTKGKASELGHSHGFFVRVLGRLLNLDDPLFGMPALSHSSFNRFRMEIDADGLDDFLTSTRESSASTCTSSSTVPVRSTRSGSRAKSPTAGASLRALTRRRQACRVGRSSPRSRGCSRATSTNCSSSTDPTSTTSRRQRWSRSSRTPSRPPRDRSPKSRSGTSASMASSRRSIRSRRR